MTERLPADDRDESDSERADRNWVELLQELRVMQTGVQVLTGFLLTLPFQQRFTELSTGQVTLYLVLVALSVATTGVLIAPVSVHRLVFRRGLKTPLVTVGARLTLVGVVMLGLVVTGTAVLAFSVVVSGTAGLIAGAITAILLLALWLVLPIGLTRRG
ncbi:DUF6328 family protein [Serinibacter salmoneus]|uniref:Sodium:proton antiporter n=1 Tax=Serinibacter salmoneus TaxID=556530 RepID=A0A2A9D2A7_9MICO|nr:DUF6328 family protein [Serinibacter salmoneus]PFG19989.1 hypothetical protein ATL40_1572 [Serinibacter salmoneus]